MSFSYSFDEAGDYYGQFDSREEALGAAQAFNLEFGFQAARIWTARNGRDVLGSEFLPGVAPMLIASAQDCSDNFDDRRACSNWLDDVTCVEEDELAMAVKSAFDAWCVRYKRVPRRWHCTEVHAHQVEAPPKEVV